VRTTTPWQLDLDHINDRDRIFSLDFSGCCVAEWLLEAVLEWDDGNWGTAAYVGDEMRVAVKSSVCEGSTGINDEVEVASDARPVLDERASDMLDFGGMGLNYKPVVSLCETAVGWSMMREHTFPRYNAARTFSEVGRAAGKAFKRLSMELDQWAYKDPWADWR
jgi:hypothetical protein